MFEFSGKTLTALITLTCSLGFMLFGYDQGVLSGIIGADNQFGQDFGHPDANTQGLIVSVYQLGNVGGSIAVFFFGDYLGRRGSIMWATIVMGIGAHPADRIHKPSHDVCCQSHHRTWQWGQHIGHSCVAVRNEYRQTARNARSYRQLHHYLWYPHCVLG